MLVQLRVCRLPNQLLSLRQGSSLQTRSVLSFFTVLRRNFCRETSWSHENPSGNYVEGCSAHSGSVGRHRARSAGTISAFVIFCAN